MTTLIKYEQARHALAVCKQVDEVKDWADKAAAMQAYGRMAKDKGLEVDAAEIRIRAERRLGELIAAQKAGPGLNRGAAATRSVETTALPTLADAGISKDLSSRAQNIAAVPEQEFEQELGEWRERVTAEGARVSARLDAKGAKARQEAAPAADEGMSVAEIMDDQERAIRERDAQIAALSADDKGEELLKQIRLVQHYQREMGMEQDKNARLLRERDTLAKWQADVVRALGVDTPRQALVVVRQRVAA